MPQVLIQVISKDDTGFLPDMGRLPATLIKTETEEMFQLDESVANYGGQILGSSQVEIV